jgi:DNA (cytosine-5)-methyltransferase 1
LIGGIDYENNGHGPTGPTGPLLKGSPTGGGRPLPAIVQAHRQVAFGEYVNDDTASAMKQRDYKDATDLVSQPLGFSWQKSSMSTTLDKSTTPAVATYSTPAIGDIRADAVASCISKNTGAGGETQNPAFVQQSMQVRRLTPKECARLQGFPDDYLDVLYRGKPAADGPRYKALGNSMAVPVMAWIGKRIQQVEEISCTTKPKYHSA